MARVYPLGTWMEMAGATSIVAASMGGTSYFETLEIGNLRISLIKRVWLALVSIPPGV